MPPAASGRQVEIAHAEQRAVVVEVGGGLRSYEWAGAPVVVGFGPGEVAPGAAGQLLLPWPNRLAGGGYRFGGREHHLPITEPATGAALHGLVRWAAFTLRRLGPGAVRAGARLHPRPGYPFTLDVHLDYSLGDAGLAVETVVFNPGPGPAPVGVGHHPYLAAGGPLERAVLRVPAGSAHELDTRHLPTGRVVEAAAVGADYRVPRPIGEALLDDCLTDLERGPGGWAEVVLEGADGVARRLEAGPGYGHLMLYTGDGLPGPLRRSGLGVEPMTCPPDALNSGRDLVVLGPGMELRLRHRLGAGPAAAG